MQKNNSKKSERISKTKKKEDSSNEKLAPPHEEKKKRSSSNSNPFSNPHTLDELPAVWILESFTQEQRDKIKAFREGPASYYIKKNTHDLNIARWLVARKWNVEASTQMFIQSMKWREKENIDNIFEWVTELKAFKFLSDYWPVSILPEKKSPKLRTYDGFQVIYERLTEMSPDILDVVPLDEMIKFHIYLQELSNREQRKILKKEKKENSYAGIVFVYDLISLTISHLTRANYNMFQIFTSYDANNYPETLRRVYLINSPVVFSIGWKVAKKFVDPSTIEKIVILGTDYHNELKKVIPPECLPISYGGTLDFIPSGGGSIKQMKKF